MDGDEVEARLSAMRTALALAISIDREPMAMLHLRNALRELVTFVPNGAHPAMRDELELILKTFLRLPTRHASHEEDPRARAPAGVSRGDVDQAIEPPEEKILHDLI